MPRRSYVIVALFILLFVVSFCDNERIYGCWPNVVGMGKRWPRRSDYLLALIHIQMWMYDHVNIWLDTIYSYSPEGATALCSYCHWNVHMQMGLVVLHVCTVKLGTHWQQSWIQHGRLCWKSTVLLWPRTHRRQSWPYRQQSWTYRQQCWNFMNINEHIESKLKSRSQHNISDCVVDISLQQLLL